MSTNTILASAPLTATGYHLKATGTTLGQSLIWDNGTNVGIGTASPDTLLHLSSTTDTSILRLERNSVTITSGQSYGQVQWEGQDASTGAAGVRSSIDVLSNGNLGETNLVFRTSGSNFNANLDRLTIDSSGNLGLGVTPSAWNGITALQIGGYASFGGDSSFVTYVSSNAYYNAGWKYIGVSAAANYYQDAGGHYFRSTSTTGTAGGSITWITPLTIASTGAATFSSSVGIGGVSATSAGGTAFMVYDSATPRIRLTNSTTGTTSTDGGELSLFNSDFNIENREAGAMNFYVNGSKRFDIASTGAATFSSTLAATGTISYTGTSNAFTATSGTTGYVYQYFANTGGTFYLGLERSTGGGLLTNGSAYATIFTTNNATNLEFGTNGTRRFYLDASTGAATFSSSVTSQVTANAAFLATSGTTSRIYSQLNNTGGNAFLGIESSTGGNLFTGSSAYATVLGNDVARSLEFATNNNIRLSIASTGNTGIGLSAPPTKLSVKGTAADATALTYNGFFGLETASQTSFQMGIGGTYNGTWFQSYNQPATGSGNFPLIFNPLGGNVLIGTTTDNNSKLLLTQSGTVNCLRINSTSASFNNYGIYFDAARNTTNDTFRAFAYYNSGAGAFKFYVLDSGNIYSTSTSITIISSDQKLKTDIRDYNKGLSEVLAMKPRIYKRKDNLEVDEIGLSN